MSRAAEARPRINALGLDGVCDALSGGGTLTGIAKEIGVATASLIAWVEAEPERSARAAEARRKAAIMWDEKAETRLDEAADPFELAKAKELAFHYRWRSKMVDPARYGDKGQVALQHLGADGKPADPAPLVVRFVGAEDGKPK